MHDYCQECGADLAGYHEPDCGMDPMNDDEDEGFIHETAGHSEFDKYMDRILIGEARQRKVNAPEDNPLRRNALRYQERPLGRTRFVTGGK